MTSLGLVHPQAAPGEILFGAELRGDELVCRFAVRGTGKPWLNPALAPDRSQWGLWDWDVVEVFLSASSRDSRYYEFQVSPLNQFFELEIFEPRMRWNDQFVSGFVHSVRAGKGSAPDAEGWEAELRIPLVRLGWDGRPESIRGNAFAILGSPDAGRAYWSLTLPQQALPDFHRPEFFRPLIT